MKTKLQLFQAAAKGTFKIEDVNNCNIDEIVHVALMNNQLTLAQTLMQMGGQIVMPEKALQWACVAGYKKAVEFILERGIVTQETLARGLMFASENGHLAIVRLLIKYGADVNKEFPLFLAAANGHLSVVKFLVKHGADVNQGKGAALCKAAINGRTSIVKFLVEHGAKVPCL